MFTDKISRTEAPSATTATTPFFPADTTVQEAGSDDPCRFWISDPQSFAVTAIKKYLTEELKWSGVSVDSFKKCDTWDPDTKHWGCDFLLSNNRKGTVFIVEKTRKVKVQLANLDGNGSIWCFYDYTCNDKNELTLTKDRCG